MPPRPFVSDLDEGTDKPAQFQSGLKRRAVEFRLTPSAEYGSVRAMSSAATSCRDRQTHEIFRQRGEYGLGAPLAFIRAGIPARAVGGYRRGEGTHGRALRQDRRDRGVDRPDRRQRARKTCGCCAARPLERPVARTGARPERLEVWARDPDAAVDFAPARFSDGVNFALRATALHRAPLKALEDETDYPELPKGSQGDAPAPGTPRYHPQGSSGGTLFAVESVNLFNLLLERPDRAAARSRRSLSRRSAATRDAKAEFLNGIVTILSETRNGFIERQKGRGARPHLRALAPGQACRGL